MFLQYTFETKKRSFYSLHTDVRDLLNVFRLF